MRPFYLLLTGFCCFQVCSADEETNALSSLYSSTNGASWLNAANWLVESPCTQAWYGVTCDDTGNVIVLSVDTNGLEGSIPTELGILTALTEIKMEDNDLQKSQIPSEMGLLTAIHAAVVLKNSNIAGTLPTQFGGLSLLTHKWNLNENSFTGSIPTELGYLTALSSKLELASNRLSGSIPTEIGSLTRLVYELELDTNSLTGLIPSELGKLTDMESDLYLNANSLCGDIPAEVSLLSSSITSFDLSDNSLGTFCPTSMPTSIPSSLPTTLPTSTPTSPGPTALPTSAPSSAPTSQPTTLPTALPTSTPSSAPTSQPTTSLPTALPTSTPSSAPSSQPTPSPTNLPTPLPTSLPTTMPTSSIPSSIPTNHPTTGPTRTPSPTTGDTVDVYVEIQMSSSGPAKVSDIWIMKQHVASYANVSVMDMFDFECKSSAIQWRRRSLAISYEWIVTFKLMSSLSSVGYASWQYYGKGVTDKLSKKEFEWIIRNSTTVTSIDSITYTDLTRPKKKKDDSAEPPMAVILFLGVVFITSLLAAFLYCRKKEVEAHQAEWIALGSRGGCSPESRLEYGERQEVNPFIKDEDTKRNGGISKVPASTSRNTGIELLKRGA